MTPYSANPFAYIFPAVALGAMLVYFMCAAIDRMGLEVRTAVATVTGKQFTESGKSYYTTIAGGRTWVEPQETPETYVVTLNMGDEHTVGLVSREMFESLNASDTVRVKIRRTRITGRLEVVEVAQ